jgi:hypothetical protein
MFGEINERRKILNNTPGLIQNRAKNHPPDLCFDLRPKKRSPCERKPTLRCGVTGVRNLQL